MDELSEELQLTGELSRARELLEVLERASTPDASVASDDEELPPLPASARAASKAAQSVADESSCLLQ